MKKFCVICGEEYECYSRKQKGRRYSYGKNSSVRYKRGINTRKCSVKCSRILCRMAANQKKIINEKEKQKVY